MHLSLRSALTIVFLQAVLSCPAIADAVPGGCAAKLEKAAKDVVAYYPAAALAAGVQGKATISCTVTPQDTRRDCHVLSEAPEGEGFGSAALAIAAASQGNPDMHLTEEQAAQMRTFTLAFSPSPPKVWPNLFSASIPRGIAWIRRPSGEDVARAEEKAGVDHKLTGHVKMTCDVNDDGHLSSCSIDEETPAGAGLDRAAEKLTPDFVLHSSYGCPLGGGKITIPLRFQPFP